MRRLLKIIGIVVGIVLLTTVAFGAGLFVGGANLLAPGIIRTTDQPEQFSIFWQAWNLVQANYVDREALDNTRLTYGAIRGMVDALGDTGHSTFLSPEQYTQQQSDLSGSFSGIGAQVSMKDGLPVIVAPLDDSPAQKAGIKAGDIILQVDGEDTTGLTLNEVVAKIRGTKGEPVTLTLLRVGDSQSMEITIVRDDIVTPTATWAMIPGTSVALIRLSQFSQNAKSELLMAIEGAQAANATGLIVDVRSNPGGLLEQAVAVTSQFLKDGNVLLEEDAQGQRTPFPVTPGGAATEIPLVVLINPGSASSSEIFAGAIQDHKRGQLVGETTFGTGTVLQPYQLQDGSALFLGVKQWLTPDGRRIRDQGIQPDVEVKIPLGTDLLTPSLIREMTPEELQSSPDLQLLKGLELLGAQPQ
ncbi:MAG: S41 family peptidase [Caldilineaceae bacterium]